MISYKQVESSMINPPSREIIDIYNYLGESILDHPQCIKEQCSYKEKFAKGKFCICATSIQPSYIAFILGKHIDTVFPEEVIQMFFNVDNHYTVQFESIEGKNVNGCICVIHSCEQKFNLKTVYDNIFS
jgi:predicted PolB exonuclease-like 3'-5' exonuclease